MTLGYDNKEEIIYDLVRDINKEYNINGIFNIIRHGNDLLSIISHIIAYFRTGVKSFVIFFENLYYLSDALSCSANARRILEMTSSESLSVKVRSSARSSMVKDMLFLPSAMPVPL